MITVKLQGGLGNQMFQYATGRALAHKLNTSLKLDISHFEIKESSDKFTVRNFDLDKFKITASVTKKAGNNFLDKVLDKIKRQKFYYEKGIQFDKAVLDFTGNYYLEGYFQCEKYFISIRNILLKEFNSIVYDTDEFKKWEQEINDTNAVAVHIRRGDYVNKSFINSVHGTCSVEYYRNAFRYLEEKLDNIRYYFFSDDMEWAMTMLSENRQVMPVHLTGNDGHIGEMLLMSKAKSNIIANSSFSWWGAWLNPRHEKIVIAPEKWFVDPVKNSQTSELLPDSWVRIKN